VVHAADEPLGWIESWVRSSALSRLVAAYGGTPPVGEDFAALLDWLERFSARWDFRAGAERNLVLHSDVPPEIAGLVLEAARELGLRDGGAPSRDRYDMVVVLGGLVRACIARPRHAARLMSSGTVDADRIVALGGFRELKGDERALVADLLDASVKDEFHAMSAGMEAAFGLTGPVATRGHDAESLGASWRVDDYESPSGRPTHVVAAPSSEPGVRRANTPDTYGWLATESGWLTAGSAVLLVTTDIYVPYQHADAIRMLTVPHHVTVDVVGVRPGDVDPRLAQQFTARQYLQEVRSTILSLRLLHRVLTGQPAR
jgi:hypothetical protein